MGGRVVPTLYQSKFNFRMIVLLFCLGIVSPLLSVPLENSVQERFFGLFRPDCSRPVFAPFGIYNPCPETTTAPTTAAPTTAAHTTAAPTTAAPTTAAPTTAAPTTEAPTTVPTTTVAVCSSSSVCGDSSSGCSSGTTCYDGSNIINGNCCGQVANFCLIQSATAGLGVPVVCP